jgi:hypothetical protein
VITGLAAVAGAWLLLWPALAGTFSRQTGADEDREEHREKPQHARASSFDHSDDRA